MDIESRVTDTLTFEVLCFVIYLMLVNVISLLEVLLLLRLRVSRKETLLYVFISNVSITLPGRRKVLNKIGIV